MTLKGAARGHVSDSEAHRNSNQLGRNTALLKSGTDPAVSEDSSVSIVTRLRVGRPIHRG